MHNANFHLTQIQLLYMVSFAHLLRFPFIFTVRMLLTTFPAILSDYHLIIRLRSVFLSKISRLFFYLSYIQSIYHIHMHNKFPMDDWKRLDLRVLMQSWVPTAWWSFLSNRMTYDVRIPHFVIGRYFLLEYRRRSYLDATDIFKDNWRLNRIA